ncbi:hypothetical protein [Paludibaculum fermentans]|uniref:DUF4384 domain-containing protein n=1 Tax=Paludibaculum fermentans TaxID=1473598 RepID=A0A7S7NUT7_PALFE|nr:hypothetical protein [Paludibaculum fermentans]QOY90133.1 hypothetical protein IRI77_09325 [Paludibaculum fermentans]
MRNLRIMTSPRALVPLLATVLALGVSAQDSPPSSSGWVVIPVNEYGSLRARAYPAAMEPEAPPLEATLTRVEYELRINGDLAAGHATITIDVLKDGWVQVPIPAGLLVREAKLDGKPAALVPGPAGRGGSQQMAVLSKRGRASLVLEVALPIGSNAGEERLTLPASESGITRGLVVLPRLDVEVRVGGGLLYEKSQSASESKWLAYGSGGSALTFAWRRKAEDHRVTQALRMRGSLTELLSLGEDSTSVYAEVNLEVVQGAASQARIRVPANVTVNQVLGATVADWEVQSNEVLVKFLEPEEKSARFVITGETRLPRDGGIDIPLLALLGAERETGGVAVEVLGAGEIKDAKPLNLDRADAAEMGATVQNRQSPSLLAFRFRPGAATSTRSLKVELTRYDQQAVLTANVEEARYRILMSLEGKTLIQARYAVRNNQRTFLKITLPAGAVVWSSSLGGRPVRPGQSPDGALLMPLERSRAGDEAPAFAVEILYLAQGTAWAERGHASLALPAVDLPVSKTGVQVFHPPLAKINVEPGPFRTEAFQEATSSVLNAASYEPAVAAMAPSAANQLDRLQTNGPPSQAATQALVDDYKTRLNARQSGAALPMMAEFPQVGPSLFLVSELTSENRGSTIELTYQKEKARGGK